MNFSVIKNSDELATTPLRRDALEILEAGYQAILTKEVVEKEVEVNGQYLRIGERVIALGVFKRIFFVGIGKCALDAGEVFEEKLGSWLTDGIILDVRGATLKKLRSKIGTHPFPSEQNVEASQSIADLLEGLTDTDLLITVISGGASSLLCLPYDLTCETIGLITKTLMGKGATIDEINTFRKHTSKIQGGQFAKLAYPATVVSLIFSDVPGDDVATVASGPTVLDTTNIADARAVLEKYDIENLCKLPECELVETPKDPEYFLRVNNILFITTKKALEAMRREAERLGYHAEIVSTELQGEARAVGQHLVGEATAPKTCRLWGGETTVLVNKEGRGGRCQEAVLGALTNIKDGVLCIAATSDGWDNTPFAGAIGDAVTLERARELGLDPLIASENNQAYDFFEKVGSHIDTGRTGANVSDWYFTLAS
jgi:glycerate-2-kinase